MGGALFSRKVRQKGPKLSEPNRLSLHCLVASGPT